MLTGRTLKQMTDEERLELACRRFASARYEKMVAQQVSQMSNPKNKADWCEAHWTDYKDEMKAALGIEEPKEVA